MYNSIRGGDNSFGNWGVRMENEASNLNWSVRSMGLGGVGESISQIHRYNGAPERTSQVKVRR